MLVTAWASELLRLELAQVLAHPSELVSELVLAKLLVVGWANLWGKVLAEWWGILLAQAWAEEALV